MKDRLLTITFFIIFYFLPAIYCYASVQVKNDANDDYLKAKECIAAAEYSCAKELLGQLLKAAVNQSDSLAIVKYKLDLADVAYQVGDFKQANTYIADALEIASANSYTDLIAKARQTEAHIEWRFGDNYSAIRNISQSIQLYEELGDTSSYLQARTILAGVYISVEKYSESEAIYYDLLKIATSTNDSVAIATCYQHLGVIAFYKEDYGRSISFYKSALFFNKLLNNDLDEALNQGNMGEALLAQGNLSEANDYLQKSLKTLKKLEFNSGIIFVLYTLGRVHHELRHYDYAHQFYLESLELMKQTGEIRERNYLYQLISENLVANGNYADALAYYKKYSAEKDSLFGVEKTRQLEELRAQYLLEESALENQKLNQQNIKVQREISVKERLLKYQYIISGIIFCSLLIFVFQFYILRRRKAKLEASNTTKNRLFSLIAHDIKNPVGNIEALINMLENTEEPKMKSDIMSMLKQSSQSVSILVKSILSWSISNKENFKFNYQNINFYQLTEKVVGLFVYDLSKKNILLDNKVDPTFEAICDEDIVATIIRNLLSNAIKFTPSQGEIKIWVDTSKNYKAIHVKDNGIGMDTQTKANILKGDKIGSKKGTNNEKGTGVGFTLINDFIDKLNGMMEIISAPNQGTEVIVYLPNYQG